jgi:hypothetical protein
MRRRATPNAIRRDLDMQMSLCGMSSHIRQYVKRLCLGWPRQPQGGGKLWGAKGPACFCKREALQPRHQCSPDTVKGLLPQRRTLYRRHTLNARSTLAGWRQLLARHAMLRLPQQCMV